MSRQSIIETNIRSIQGRSFRFMRCFHRRRKFKCFVCGGTGYKGYILEDSNSRILVGERCFQDNFLITVR